MKNIGIFRVLLVLLLSCAAINANASWWDSWKSAGDDGNVNSQGNAAAQLQQQIIFNISNNSISNISRIIVTDSNGKTIYNHAFMCQTEKKCQLKLSSPYLGNGLSFRFLDVKNELVAAYLTDSLSPVNNIMLDESWLGLYVFNQIVKISKKQPEVLNFQLVQAFSGVHSPDNTPDIYEELGLYFIAHKGGANETKFYAMINKKLDNKVRLVAVVKETLQENLTTPILVTSSVGRLVSTTGTGVCDPAVQSTFSYIQNVAGFIPFAGDVLGSALGIGSQILADSCPADSDMAVKFAEIDDRLNKFDQELKSLNFSIAELQKYVDQNQTENTLEDMQKHYSLLRNGYMGTYIGVAGNSGLINYVNKNGGLKLAHANSQQLKELLANIPEQITAFDNILTTGQLKKMKASLDRVCRDVSKTPGNIIAVRSACNVAVARAVLIVDSSGLRLQTMLNDEIAVINNAINSGNIDAKWLRANVSDKLQYNGRSYEWNSAAKELNVLISTKMKLVDDMLVGLNGKELYKPLDGLSLSLQQNIIAAQCVTGKLPAIKEWHTLHANGNNPYLVTECGDGRSAKIISKYFYNKRGTDEVDNKVINVMGVLVPGRYFHGGHNDNYGYDSAFPWTTANTITTKIGPNEFLKDSTVSGYFNATTGNLKSAVIGSNPENVRVNGILMPGTVSQDSLGIIAFREEKPGRLVTHYKMDAYRRDYFTVLRYTKDGYSYVWVMRTWGDYDNGGLVRKYKYYLNGSQQCLTNDCSINNTVSSPLKQIKFIDGTTFAWTKTVADTKISLNPGIFTSDDYSEYQINVK